MEMKRREETRNDVLFVTGEITDESARVQKKTRNYNIKILDAKVCVEAATTPGWRIELAAGDLKNILSENCVPIWQIARRMRIRPEAVLRLLSDAFDENLTKRALVVEDGCLCFESDIATITLEPGEDGLDWELKYKAKEAMYCKDIRPHGIEVFTVPVTLSSGRVLFPDKALHQLISLADDLSEPSSVELMDKLNRDYQRALKEKTFSYDEDTLTFKTQFWTRENQQIFAAIEPHYYEPIPNTWLISRFWGVERYDFVDISTRKE